MCSMAKRDVFRILIENAYYTIKYENLINDYRRNAISQRDVRDFIEFENRLHKCANQEIPVDPKDVNDCVKKFLKKRDTQAACSKCCVRKRKPKKKCTTKRRSCAPKKSSKKRSCSVRCTINIGDSENDESTEDNCSDSGSDKQYKYDDISTISKKITKKCGSTLKGDGNTCPTRIIKNMDRLLRYGSISKSKKSSTEEKHVKKLKVGVDFERSDQFVNSIKSSCANISFNNIRDDRNNNFNRAVKRSHSSLSNSENSSFLESTEVGSSVESVKDKNLTDNAKRIPISRDPKCRRLNNTEEHSSLAAKDDASRSEFDKSINSDGNSKPEHTSKNTIRECFSSTEERDKNIILADNSKRSYVSKNVKRKRLSSSNEHSLLVAKDDGFRSVFGKNINLTGNSKPQHIATKAKRRRLSSTEESSLLETNDTNSLSKFERNSKLAGNSKAQHNSRNAKRRPFSSTEEFALLDDKKKGFCSVLDKNINLAANLKPQNIPTNAKQRRLSSTKEPSLLEVKCKRSCSEFDKNINFADNSTAQHISRNEKRRCLSSTKELEAKDDVLGHHKFNKNINLADTRLSNTAKPPSLKVKVDDSCSSFNKNINLSDNSNRRYISKNVTHNRSNHYKKKSLLDVTDKNSRDEYLQNTILTENPKYHDISKKINQSHSNDTEKCTSSALEISDDGSITECLKNIDLIKNSKHRQISMDMKHSSLSDSKKCSLLKVPDDIFSAEWLRNISLIENSKSHETSKNVKCSYSNESKEFSSLEVAGDVSRTECLRYSTGTNNAKRRHISSDTSSENENTEDTNSIKDRVHFEESSLCTLQTTTKMNKNTLGSKMAIRVLPAPPPALVEDWHEGATRVPYKVDT
ncbi:spindle assembly checkpoint component MAD1-like [Teleopsis dalmanni]|uniref:spindle assembly checkpoint component MAD1-like n=1 Tax=Teleopsis dalmanni TaxID=139649 RepID=UPI0018CD4017|nr:spindle assembly checkpoint component MAD1-like [Teleopsis dalmanni]